MIEKTVAHEPLTTACDDALEKSERRRAITRQTCGRDDSFETTEAAKTEEAFLTFRMRRGEMDQ